MYVSYVRNKKKFLFFFIEFPFFQEKIRFDLNFLHSNKRFLNWTNETLKLQITSTCMYLIPIEGYYNYNYIVILMYMLYMPNMQEK